MMALPTGWPQNCSDLGKGQGAFELMSVKLDEIQQNWTRLMGIWCSLMHPTPMWPIHGHYECPKCHRIYGVPWKNH
jgi:hypothetical protein